MVKENRESYNSELRSYRNQLNIKMKAAAKKKLTQYMRAYGPPTFETIKLLIRDFNLSIEGVEVMFNRSLCYVYQIFDEQRMDAIQHTIDDPYIQERYVQNIYALRRDYISITITLRNQKNMIEEAIRKRKIYERLNALHTPLVYQEEILNSIRNEIFQNHKESYISFAEKSYYDLPVTYHNRNQIVPIEKNQLQDESKVVTEEKNIPEFFKSGFKFENNLRKRSNSTKEKRSNDDYELSMKSLLLMTTRVNMGGQMESCHHRIKNYVNDLLFKKMSLGINILKKKLSDNKHLFVEKEKALNKCENAKERRNWENKNIKRVYNPNQWAKKKKYSNKRISEFNFKMEIRKDQQLMNYLIRMSQSNKIDTISD